MQKDRVTFRRIGGRVVPVRAKEGYKPRQGLRVAASVATAAAGIISGATMFSKGGRFWKGQGSAVGLELLSPSLNVAAHAGRGHAGDRAKGMAIDEARNQAIGWSAFGATSLMNPAGRKAATGLMKRILKVVK